MQDCTPIKAQEQRGLPHHPPPLPLPEPFPEGGHSHPRRGDHVFPPPQLFGVEGTGNRYCWTRGQWTRGRLLALVAGSLLRLLSVALPAGAAVVRGASCGFVSLSSVLLCVCFVIHLHCLLFRGCLFLLSFDANCAHLCFHVAVLLFCIDVFWFYIVLLLLWISVLRCCCFHWCFPMVRGLCVCCVLS